MPLSVISSSSMEPALYKGDIIIWVPCKAEDVKVGDIIVFKSYVNEKTIIAHRVIKIEMQNNEPTFVTKGDNNPSPDQYGSHAVEPNIRSNHLLGRVVSIGNFPIKFPHVGLLWLGLQDFKNDILKNGMFAGSAILPLIITCGFILIWLVSVSKNPKREKIELLIAGPKKESLIKILFQALVLFLCIMLSTFIFANSSISISVGVSSPAEPANIKVDNMKVNQVVTKNYHASNNGFSNLKCVCFCQGDAEKIVDVGDQIYTLKPGEKSSKNITIVSTEEVGTYNGNIKVYSSPFWVLLPDDFMKKTLEWNHEGAIIVYDVVSALILTFITIFIIIVLTFIANLIQILWTYMTAYSVIKEGKIQDMLTCLGVKIGKIYDRMKSFKIALFSNLDEIETVEININKSLAASFAALPFVLISHAGYTFAAVLMASLFVGIFAYIIGCKKRAEVVFASFTTVIVHVILFTLPPIISRLPPVSSPILLLGSIIYGLGITLLYASLLLIPGSALSYYGARMVLAYDLKRNPIKEIDENIDF